MELTHSWRECGEEWRAEEFQYTEPSEPGFMVVVPYCGAKNMQGDLIDAYGVRLELSPQNARVVVRLLTNWLESLGIEA